MIDTIPCFDAVHDALTAAESHTLPRRAFPRGTSDAARFRWAVWQHARSAQRYVTDPPLDRLRREFAPSLALRLRVYARNAGRLLRALTKVEGLWPRRGWWCRSPSKVPAVL